MISALLIPTTTRAKYFPIIFNDGKVDMSSCLRNTIEGGDAPSQSREGVENDSESRARNSSAYYCSEQVFVSGIPSPVIDWVQ